MKVLRFLLALALVPTFLRAQIVEKLAAKYHAPVVRLQPILDQACNRAPAEYWLWDGIDPDHQGHYLLAEEWLHVVNNFYGSLFSK
jgi:hypothetical protein